MGVPLWGGLSALAFIIIPENNYKELKQSLNPSRGNIQKSKFILRLCKSPARGMQAKILLPVLCKRLKRQPVSCCLFCRNAPKLNNSNNLSKLYVYLKLKKNIHAFFKTWFIRHFNKNIT